MQHRSIFPVPENTARVAPPMTSMIDVVFLLITFFMLVSEFTRQNDLAGLHLPDVAEADPDEDPDLDRIVVNITRDGTLHIGPNAVTPRQLGAELANEVRLAEGRVAPPLQIRADRETPFRHVRTVLQLCTEHRIRIWRVSFGAQIDEHLR